MDAQVATILEIINIHKTINLRSPSTEAKQTQLPYYTSPTQAKLHEDAAYVIPPTKIWDRMNPEGCRVMDTYDFVIHAASTVVTIVNKDCKLYREGNQIKGGRNFYIRSVNKYTNKPHGLFRVADSVEDLIIEIKNKSREEYMDTARQIREWYINQSKNSPIYVHYGGFDVMQIDIDAFILYVNSQVE